MYFGFLGGSLPSKPSSSDNKHRKLVVADQLAAAVGVYCKAAQMWHSNYIHEGRRIKRCHSEIIAHYKLKPRGIIREKKHLTYKT